MKTQFNITGGPCIGDLITSFQTAYKDVKVQVEFQTPTGPLKCRIIGIEYEDGSGQSFNIKALSSTGDTRIYYNARTRKGTGTVNI